jgi:hypothetical protein
VKPTPTIEELKKVAMALDMEISDLLEQWRKDHAGILDRKAAIDIEIMELEKEI